ncbi:MAG: GNAT family N-acetyltransferase, partial [Gemmatimonadetes bacterium]|nr:GNAT family N-acetyltransferase [Gemmatimonadota bacterium]
LWPDAEPGEHADAIARYFAGTLREPIMVLFAEDGHARPKGFVELSLRAYAEGCKSDNVAYVEGWYVAPDARGRGVGRALIEAAEDWARGQGCTELASDAQSKNVVSAATHEALGFSEVGQIRCFRKVL